jgi:hypothetical protein
MSPQHEPHAGVVFYDLEPAGAAAHGHRLGAEVNTLVEGLRLMAFEKSIATELWDTARFRYEPS